MRTFYFLVLSTFISGTVPAQSSIWHCTEDITLQGLQSAHYALQSPARASTGEWLTLAAAGGALAYSIHRDVVFQRDITSARSPTADAVSRYFSEPFGNPYYIGAAVTVNYFIACGFENEPWSRASGQMFESVALASGVTLLLKAVIDRSRPGETISGQASFRSSAFGLEHNSFPSGHATVAFALATSTSLALDLPWYYATPLHLAALSTAWSRIYESAHWPSDVLLGAMIGSWTAWQVHQRRQGDKRAQWSLMPLPQGGVAAGMQLTLD